MLISQYFLHWPLEMAEMLDAEGDGQVLPIQKHCNCPHLLDSGSEDGQMQAYLAASQERQQLQQCLAPRRWGFTFLTKHPIPPLSPSCNDHEGNNVLSPFPWPMIAGGGQSGIGYQVRDVKLLGVRITVPSVTISHNQQHQMAILGGRSLETGENKRACRFNRTLKIQGLLLKP